MAEGGAKGVSVSAEWLSFLDVEGSRVSSYFNFKLLSIGMSQQSHARPTERGRVTMTRPNPLSNYYKQVDTHHTERG